MTSRTLIIVILSCAGLGASGDVLAQSSPAESALKQALGLQSAGKHEEALGVLESALKADPSVPALHATRGRVMRSLRKPFDAYKSMSKALELNPDFHPARFERAKLLLDVEKFDAAVADATYLIDKGKNAWEIRAVAHMEARRDGDSLRDFSSMVEEERKQPDSPGKASSLDFAHHMRARLFMRARAYDLAVAEFSAALKFKESAVSLRGRSEALMHLEKYEDSLADATLAIEKQASPQTYFERAIVLIHAGRPDDAKADIQRGLQQAPGEKKFQEQAKRINERFKDYKPKLNLPEIRERELREKLATTTKSIDKLKGDGAQAKALLELYVERVGTHTRLSEWNAVVSDCEAGLKLTAAIAANPTSAGRLHSALGQAYAAKKENARADVAFATAMKLAPDDPKTVSRWARYLSDNGKLTEALAVYDKVQKLAPDAASSYSERALVLRHMKKYGEAFKECSRALVIDPDNIDALKVRGGVAFLSGQAAAALADFEKVVELGDPSGHQFLGVNYLSRDVNLPALREFSAALQSEPRDGRLVSLRADALFHLGVFDVSMTEFEQAVALGYAEPRSRESLGILHSGAGMHQKAVDDFTFEIEAGATNPFMWIQRGLAYDKLARFEESASDFRTAIARSEKGSQPAQIATDGLESTQMQIQLRKVFEAVDGKDGTAFASHLTADVRPLVDAKELGRLFGIVQSRFGKLLECQWKDFRKDQDAKVPSATVVFALSDGETIECRAIYAGMNELLGLQFTSGTMNFDTLGAVKADSFEANAAEFWAALYGGKVEQAYNKFVGPDHKDERFREQFYKIANTFIKGIQAKGATFTSISHDATRLVEPVAAGRAVEFQVFQTVKLSTGKFGPSRLQYELTEGGFQPTDFHTGEFENRYPTVDVSKPARFFTALASGDANKVIEEMGPDAAESVDTRVLSAFMQRLRESVGPFERIDPAEFRVVTSFSNGERHERGEGVVRFAKRSLLAESEFQFDTLSSFNVRIDLGDWVSLIEHTDAFRAGGKDLFEAFGLEDPAKAEEMLGSSLAEAVREGKIKNFHKMFREEVGAVKQIDFESHESLKDRNVLRFHFTVTGEKRTVKVYVDYGFSVFSGSIRGFNVALD